MTIQKISAKHLVWIWGDYSSNVRLKTPTFDVQNKSVLFYSFMFLKVLILEQGSYFTGLNSSRDDIKIRKNKIEYFKAIHKSMMAAQKRKKKIVSRKFLAFLNASYPKTHLIQSLNS